LLPPSQAEFRLLGRIEGNGNVPSTLEQRQRKSRWTNRLASRDCSNRANDLGGRSVFQNVTHNSFGHGSQKSSFIVFHAHHNGFAIFPYLAHA
jgi:hypothetical protein